MPCILLILFFPGNIPSFGYPKGRGWRRTRSAGSHLRLRTLPPLRAAPLLQVQARTVISGKTRSSSTLPCQHCSHPSPMKTHDCLHLNPALPRTTHSFSWHSSGSCCPSSTTATTAHPHGALRVLRPFPTQPHRCSSVQLFQQSVFTVLQCVFLLQCPHISFQVRVLGFPPPYIRVFTVGTRLSVLPMLRRTTTSWPHSLLALTTPRASLISSPSYLRVVGRCTPHTLKGRVTNPPHLSVHSHLHSGRTHMRWVQVHSEWRPRDT